MLGFCCGLRAAARDLVLCFCDACGFGAAVVHRVLPNCVQFEFTDSHYDLNDISPLYSIKKHILKICNVQIDYHEIMLSNTYDLQWKTYFSQRRVRYSYPVTLYTIYLSVECNWHFKRQYPHPSVFIHRTNARTMRPRITIIEYYLLAHLLYICINSRSVYTCKA